jgi:hypothetical protein
MLTHDPDGLSRPFQADKLPGLPPERGFFDLMVLAEIGRSPFQTGRLV